MTDDVLRLSIMEQALQHIAAGECINAVGVTCLARQDRIKQKGITLCPRCTAMDALNKTK